MIARAALAPGPDTFGYTVSPTAAYSFTNISTTGIKVLNFDDDASVILNLGFSFNFYGSNYTNIAINPNGLMSFGGTNTDYLNVNLNTTSPSNNCPVIADLWCDYETESVGADALYYKLIGSPGSRQFVVQWNQVMLVPGVGVDTITFQARLFESSNRLLFSYLDVVVADDPPYSNGAYATVGIRDTDGQLNGRNLLWSHNQAAVTNGMHLLFKPPNRPPVASNDSAATPKNTPVTIPVLVNDSDPDGDALTITGVSPTNGTAAIVGTNVVFTPATNFSGGASVLYTISDGTASVAAVITINVTNRPPVAVNDATSTPKNVPVTIGPLANDSDPDRDALTITSVSPTNGTAVIVDTNVVFTPATNFTGSATVGYTVSDGATTARALITINVTNRPPVAVNDTASTPKNTPVTISPLENDSDPDDDPLTIVGVGSTNGSVNIVSTNVVFTPASNYAGNVTIFYTIRDGNAYATAAIFVAVTNRAPTAMDDTASTSKHTPVAIPVLSNDSDPDNDPLTIISVNPTNGTVNIIGTNVVFTPATNFAGSTAFAYTISDGSASASALVTVIVTNRPPTAIDDAASTPKNTPVTVNPLNNDNDPDGDTLTIVSVNPTNGTAYFVGTNVVFSPAINFTGSATVGYTISDGSETTTALITIEVTNRPPVAVNDKILTGTNVPVTIPVLANDSDPDDDPLTIISVNPTNGMADIVGTNVVFTPATNFAGRATASYTISDGTATATALITVGIGNQLPVPTNDAASTSKNLPLTISPLDNDRDPDGDILAIVSVNPTNGAANIVGTNVIFTPATNFTGNATVGYTVSDSFGGTANGLITVIVTNRPPVAAADHGDTYHDIPLVLSVSSLLANDNDPDPGELLAVTTVNATSSAGGIVAWTNATIIYNPLTNFIGSDSFSYTITDSSGSSATGLVQVTVWPWLVITSINQNSNGAIRLQATGIPGRTNQVEASVDAWSWNVIGNPSEGSPGTYEFEDLTATNAATRLYRFQAQ